MNIRALVKRPRNIFYGWWVVLAGSFIAAIGGGVHFYGFSVFFLPISKDLNLSRTATSLVFSLARLEGSIEAPFVGWLVDRFGARKLIVFGILLFSAGFIAMNWMNSLLTFIVLYAVAITIGAQTGFMGTQHGPL